MGVMRVIRVIENKNRPAQPDSGIYNLKTSPYRPYCPYRPLDFKTAPAQADSGIYNLGVGILRILRSLGILGWKIKKKTSPAQRDSDQSDKSDLSDASDCFPQNNNSHKTLKIKEKVLWLI